MNILSRIYTVLRALRLGWMIPVIRLCRREDPRRQWALIGQQIALPIMSILLFLMIWSKVVDTLPTTNLGKLPGPGQVWSAYGDLRAEARLERIRQQHHELRQLQRLVSAPATREVVSNYLQQERNIPSQSIEILRSSRPPARFQEESFIAFFEDAEDGLKNAAGLNSPAAVSNVFHRIDRAFAHDPDVRVRQYGGRPTYNSQIRESLATVFVGFLFASFIAIPVGILCGLSRNIYASLNIFIQIFKPVSPLAWLPIVTLVVVALYSPSSDGLPISFVVSAIVVALCSLWPTLVNTAVGVASMDQDHLNVAKVLKLGWFSQLFKIILPASLPLMFTGLRISLGVGWMVLIAAEMLAQNPGLGKFVWDMFQSGSSETLAMIVVAVFTIGIIGFFLDTIMSALQTFVTFEEKHG